VAKVIGLFATDSELVVPSVLALTDLLNNGDIMEEVVQPMTQSKKKGDKKKYVGGEGRRGRERRGGERRGRGERRGVANLVNGCSGMKETASLR
jgi:hypothetical protein